MTLFDALKREVDHDLPEQASDDELLAWGRDLQSVRPRRRQLVAEPIK